MKVLKCVLFNSEMVSDSWKWEEVNDFIIKVSGKFVTKGAEDYGIESEEGTDDKAETVIDIVDAMKLVEVQNWDKKAFMGYIKGYLKKVTDHMKTNGREDKIKEFQKACTDFIKEVCAKFEEYQFFRGENDTEYEGAWAYSIYDQDKGCPVFYYIKDGLKEEKF